MAKQEISVEQAILVLARQEGLALPPELLEQAEAIAAAQAHREVCDYFDRHVLPAEMLNGNDLPHNEEDEVDREQVITGWTTQVFDLASLISSTIKGETQSKRGMGGGHIFVRALRLNIGGGSLKIEFTVDQD